MSQDLPISVAIFNHGQWEALSDGRVKPKGTNPTVTHPGDVYRQMVRNLAYDVAEIAMTTFLAAKSFNIPISAIPVFSNRDVTMSGMVYNAKSGIKEPKDLEGKRVGLRAYTVTNNTQARYLLRTEFGVDTDKITWVVTEDAHVAQYKEPPNVVYAPEGRKLEDMLKAGEIDAGIQLSVPIEGDIKQLLTEEEANEVGLKFFKRTGIYPIGHIMTIRNDTLEAYPWLPKAMFDAFAESKHIYLDSLASRPNPNNRDRQSLRNRELLGGKDPLPFGLKENRKHMEAMIKMDVDQKIIPASVPVDSLFAPNSLDLEE
jgi:4,5-dihydroxyphthalate decarboxylase